MGTKKDEAIVLRVHDYGESDAIVSLFTKEEGRLSGIAKGARKSSKRFGPSLEPGAWIQFIYEEKPHRDLVFLKEASLLNFSQSWRATWKTITVGSFALELASRLLAERQSAQNKFDFLRDFLMELKEATAEEHLISFQYQWLVFSGWEPNMKICGICNAGFAKAPSVQKIFDHYWQHILSKPLVSRKLLEEALLV